MGQDSTELGTEFMATITSTRVAGSKIVFSGKKQGNESHLYPNIDVIDV